MEMPDVLPVPVPAVLMFSMLLLSLDNVTSPAGSGVAVGMEKGTCGSATPPPAQAARAAASGSKDRALYFIAYSILMMC